MISGAAIRIRERHPLITQERIGQELHYRLVLHHQVHRQSPAMKYRHLVKAADTGVSAGRAASGRHTGIDASVVQHEQDGVVGQHD